MAGRCPLGRGEAPGPELARLQKFDPRRLRESHGGPTLCRQELVQLAAQLIIAATFPIQKSGTLRRRQIERVDE
jgi:hypothetical protein